MNDNTTPFYYGSDVTMLTLAPTDAGAVDESGFSQSLLNFAAIMTFLIMFVGICGNFLTVVALLKCPKVRNVAAAFIINLCLADLLFCALVLPFQGLRFVQGTWRHGAVLCRLIPFIQYGNIGVSLLCIAMITINRYVMITHHGLYARIYKRHWIAIMIAACWLVSYGMQLPTLLGAWGRFGYDSRLQTCSIMSDSHGHSSKTTLFITAFVIPCLVIIACYAKIFWVVHKSEQRLKRHANKQNSIPNNLRPVVTAGSLPTGADGQTQAAPTATASRVSSDSSSYSTDVPEAVGAKPLPSRIKDQREVRAKRNEWRITKMVLAIFLSFVICYLPITIVKVADKHVEHPSLHIFSYIMLYLSACINPIIYVIMNKQYRKAYKTVVLCQPTRLLLPFGKTNGASSAAEKWKDTGLSNNHSRTVVSQMSGGAAAAAATTTPTPTPTATATPTASQSCTAPAEMNKSSQLQSLELIARSPELLSKTNLAPSTPAPPPPSVTLAVNGNSRLQPKKSNHSYINNGFNSSGNSSGSSLSSAVYRPVAGILGSSGSAGTRRITMVGDDIILEEEELPTTPNPSPSSSPITVLPPDLPLPPPVPAPATAPAPAATTTTSKSHIYMNVDSPKRIPSYSVHSPSESIKELAKKFENPKD
ncbi:moody [Drosophila busckii]|uniref:Moody n=1 Tax=Drosophila busckii TaxID=30019 RepID=A0A0M4F907_DROBS|nr:G-protein coupled receptor moody [Drosophila busckii]XP_017852531.1 G-protein coupled receptor moody [Drosophila busckii]XP_017852532.1 G-protein coupled receptor moody [Drosophila busckii]ALC48607.1 moody [Drosophila busckii]